MLFSTYRLANARQRLFLREAAAGRHDRKVLAYRYSIRERFMLAAGKMLVSYGKRLQRSVLCKPVEKAVQYT